MAVVAADIEFMALLELLLQEGSVLSMADLHKKYIESEKLTVLLYVIANGLV